MTSKCCVGAGRQTQANTAALIQRHDFNGISKLQWKRLNCCPTSLSHASIQDQSLTSQQVIEGPLSVLHVLYFNISPCRCDLSRLKQEATFATLSGGEEEDLKNSVMLSVCHAH